MRTIKYFIFVLVALGFTACEDAITFYQDDDRYVLSADALKSPEDVQELLNSVYDVEANFLGGQMQNLGELLADPISDPSGRHEDYTQIWKHRTDFFNGTIDGVYSDAYIAIYRANTLLEAVDGVNGVTPEFSQRVKAESRFIRAFNHFVVQRLFAQPYVPGTVNSQPGIIIKTQAAYVPRARNTVEEGYAQILTDLRYAAQNLPDVNGVYATKWSAKAALAKVYLEMGNIDSALVYANDVITNGPFALDNLDRFEQGTSTERIFWVVSTVTPDFTDKRGGGFQDNYRTDQPSPPTLQVSNFYYNTASVDTADIRFNKWFDVIGAGTSSEGYGSSKFNYDFIDIPVIHLTEMVLIKAECLYELGDDPGAIAELNKLRQRANVDDYPSNLDRADVYTAVHFERLMEMCFEGDRVFQLKRQGALGRISEIRGVDWDCDGMILQFPNSEGTIEAFDFNPGGGCN